MEAVHGKDVIVEMLVEGDYYPILCGTDCTFSRVPEFIPTTSPSSGLFREYMIRREEWSMSVSGLTKIENSASLTFFYMLQTGVRRSKHTVRITFEDSDGNSKEINGSILIGQMDINGPFGDFSQCSIELKGTGAFVIGDVTPPIAGVVEYFADYWQTVDGQNYISGASSGQYDGINYTLTADDEILGVSVEGTEFYASLSTPTPGEPEFEFVTSPVKILFPADLIFNGTQRVYVLFKRTT